MEEGNEPPEVVVSLVGIDAGINVAFTDKQVVLGDEDDRVDGGSVLRDYFSVG